jgi:hypothetical protein
MISPPTEPADSFNIHFDLLDCARLLAVDNGPLPLGDLRLDILSSSDSLRVVIKSPDVFPTWGLMPIGAPLAGF